MRVNLRDTYIEFVLLTIRDSFPTNDKSSREEDDSAEYDMNASSFPALQERSLRRQEEGEICVHRMSVSEDDRSTLAQHSGVWMCHVTHINKIRVHSLGVNEEDQSALAQQSGMWMHHVTYLVESRRTCD